MSTSPHSIPTHSVINDPHSPDEETWLSYHEKQNKAGKREFETLMKQAITTDQEEMLYGHYKEMWEEVVKPGFNEREAACDRFVKKCLESGREPNWYAMKKHYFHGMDECWCYSSSDGEECICPTNESFKYIYVNFDDFMANPGYFIKRYLPKQ